MGSLFQEIKRRKVFRVAAIYAVVAWVLIQVADTIAPMMNLPESASRLVLFLLIILFPIALFLAWAYEVTPDGIRADAGTQQPQNINQNTDRNLIYAILGLVLLVAGFQVADRFSRNGISNQSENSLASEANVQVKRSNLMLGPLISMAGSGFRANVALSPDGSRLVYTSFSKDQTQLLVRDLDSLESRPLGAPFDLTPSALGFSPDGEWLAYVDSSNRSLMKISIDGGAAIPVAGGVNNSGFSWAADDTIFFAVGNRLASVPASGGEVQLLDILARSDRLEVSSWPFALPNQNAILFTRHVPPGGMDETGALELFDLDTGESQLLIRNAYNGMYSSSEHIIFMRQGSLWAVPFDLENRRISGSEVLLVERIEGPEVVGAAVYSLSNNGDLVYLPGENIELTSRKSSLAWVDRDGEETLLEMVPQAISKPRLSPEGDRVAFRIFQDQSGSSDIWSYDLDRGSLSRITFTGLVIGPVWSPEGDRLVFYTPDGFLSVNANGIGEIEVLRQESGLDRIPQTPNSFTPDGSQLLYTERQSSGLGDDIFSLSTAPERAIIPLLTSEFNESAPSISPDGRWLAYVSDETGEREVYVRPFPEIESNKWRISIAGGRDPQWAANTGELFYRRPIGEGRTYETYGVSVASEAEFDAGTPQLLFTSDHYHMGSGSYSVSADGQRFMMLKPVDAERVDEIAVPTNLVLVENFDEELKRLVPADMQ